LYFSFFSADYYYYYYYYYYYCQRYQLHLRSRHACLCTRCSFTHFSSALLWGDKSYSLYRKL
jgi:hypothetical protein